MSSTLNGTLPFPLAFDAEAPSIEQISEDLRVFNEAKVSPPTPTKNLTAQWLEQNYKRVRGMLVEHLSRKLPTSRRISVIEDHIQTFFCRLVKKDTLASHIRAGKTVQDSVLRVWAWQSACTEMRGWGVDASLRKSRGAKTNRDRMADAGKLPRVIVQSPEPVVEHRYEVSNGTVFTDLHDPNARTAEDEMIASETMHMALAFVRGEISDEDTKAAVLQTLAREAGVSRSKMAAMLGRVRSVVRDADPVD